MPLLQKTVFAGSLGLLGVGCYCYLSGSPWFFKHVAMPAARVLDPETAHRTSIFLASKGLLPKDRSKDPMVLVREKSLNELKSSSVHVLLKGTLS